jgi:hypothetical protein
MLEIIAEEFMVILILIKMSNTKISLLKNINGLFVRKINFSCVLLKLEIVHIYVAD